MIEYKMAQKWLKYVDGLSRLYYMVEVEKDRELMQQISLDMRAIIRRNTSKEVVK